MLGRNLRLASGLPAESAIVVGTLDELRRRAPQLRLPVNPGDDAYWLKTHQVNGAVYTVVTAQNDRGVVYGAFALLRKIALGEPVADLDERESPYSPIRWVNEWDNLDGSIERGYGGRSIFWENGGVRPDLQRINDYARMLASIGVNGCAINNVNANPLFLSSGLIPQVARVADVFRRWGISGRTRGGLARCCHHVVSANVRHSRLPRTCRSLSRPHRSGIGGSGWLYREVRHALGNSVRRTGDRMCRSPVFGHFPI